MIEVFGLQLRLYGLMVGLSMLCGGWVSSRVAEKEGLEKNVVWDGLVWVMGFGLVGARIYHVVDLWGYYSQNLGQIVAVWNGGMGIFGGLVGGAVGLFLFLEKDQIFNFQFSIFKKERHKKMLTYLDVGSFGVPLGQAVGRLGNFFNQELYGWPSDLPWAIFISSENRLAGFEQFTHFHPLFLYEGLLSLMLFSLMWKLYDDSNHYTKRRLDDGEIHIKSFKSFYIRVVGKMRVGSGKYLGLYMVGYGVIRFLLEPLRIEKWEVGAGVPMAWFFSGIMVVVGGYLLVRSKSQMASPPPNSPC